MSSERRKTRSNLPRKLVFKQARKHETHPKDVGEFHPHIHIEAELLLSKIGVPEHSDFVPDPFQKQALENILVIK